MRIGTSVEIQENGFMLDKIHYPWDSIVSYRMLYFAVPFRRVELKLLMTNGEIIVMTNKTEIFDLNLVRSVGIEAVTTFLRDIKTKNENVRKLGLYRKEKYALITGVAIVIVGVLLWCFFKKSDIGFITVWFGMLVTMLFSYFE